MATVTQLKERDRLRAALLSSVSHDLRTPLTTILGTLAEIEPASDAQAAQLASARGEAERLNRFVANLLDMVRIESGALHQSIEPVDLAEAIAAAAHDLRRALADHPIQLDCLAGAAFRARGPPAVSPLPHQPARERGGNTATTAGRSQSPRAACRAVSRSA